MRLVREAADREIEQDRAFVAGAQTETDLTAIARNREITSVVTAHVGNGAFLPNQLFAIERDQAEGRVCRGHCDLIAAGQELHDGVPSHSRIASLTAAFLVPDANRIGALSVILSARIKPRAVGGPGDATEVAIVHVCRIGGEQALQVLGAIDFDGCRVIKPDCYPVAVRMDGNAVRFFIAKRSPLPFKLEVRPSVAPQQAIIGHRIKPARCIERGAVAVLPAVIPVLPDEAPAGRFPNPQALATGKRCRKISAVGRPGEMVNHIVELAETADELSSRRVKNINPVIAAASIPSSGGDEPAIR